MKALCRDCDWTGEVKTPRCPSCGSPRTIFHEELASLSMAHLDCDAFYASVEKRDDPSIRDKPVIVGGGKRGVVTTACYIARISGVRSAMPMFKARELCPDAVIIKPNMAKYVAVSRQIRQYMDALTPLVDWTTSDAVNQGRERNTLRATCVGDYLSFSVNGQQVAQVTDPTYREGQIGLVASAANRLGVTIEFDNLAVFAGSAQ